MNELFNKISSYHLFNYLLPGCLFVAVATATTEHHLEQTNPVLGLFVYYFYGLMISRVGSLLLKPFLEWIGFLGPAQYADFVAACKNDSKIDELSETNNMYRSLCSLLIVLILLLAITALERNFQGIRKWELPFLIPTFLVLLLFSYKKQTEYITKRVKANLVAK